MLGISINLYVFISEKDGVCTNRYLYAYGNT